MMKRKMQSTKRNTTQLDSETESEDDDVEIHHESESDFDYVPDDEFEEDVNDKGDGLANTMAQLLQQNIGGKVPVLAGRKTKLMKDMENSKKETNLVAKKREDKRRKINEKIATAQSSNVEIERQLRKLATKGVVALFNAVAKSKRESSLQEESKKKKSSKMADSNSFTIKDEPNNVVNKEEKRITQSQSKGWKAVSDEQIPLDWDKDEFDD